MTRDEAIRIAEVAVALLYRHWGELVALFPDEPSEVEP